MSIIINTNISSMQGIRALNKSTGSLNQALERLSTGYRINSSKDDAACCAISASLRKDISSLTVAQSNAQMGQSMIDTANGSLSNISTLLQRMRDLTEQAANGTYGTDERLAMQTEVNNLITEMYRTKTSTEFNGKQVLGAETQGISEEQAISEGYKTVHNAQELKDALKTSDKTCKVMLFSDIDLNELGFDETGSNWTAVGVNGDSFQGILDGNGFTIYNLKIYKPDEHDQALIGFTNGATIKNLTVDNADVAGNNDVGCIVGLNNSGSLISNCHASGSVKGRNNVGVLAGWNVNGNARIIDCTSSGIAEGHNAVGGLVGSCTSNITTTIKNCCSVAKVTAVTSNVGAILGRLATGTLLNNQYNSIINEGINAVGAGLDEPTGEEVTDNPNLTEELLQKLINGIVGTNVNLQVGIVNDDYSTIEVDTGLKFGNFYVNFSNENYARIALKSIDKLMSKVTEKQTELGAMSNRLMTAMEYQDVQKSANIATNSVIKDADFAKESSNYIKSQILQNTTASLLATANQNPSIALMLVTGTQNISKRLI